MVVDMTACAGDYMGRRKTWIQSQLLSLLSKEAVPWLHDLGLSGMVADTRREVQTKKRIDTGFGCD